MVQNILLGITCAASIGSFAIMMHINAELKKTKDALEREVVKTKKMAVSAVDVMVADLKRNLDV